MTKVLESIVKCAKCGEESRQMRVCSVNFSLGSRESNERLLNHKQECPHCHYKAYDISVLTEDENEEVNLDDLIKRIDEKIEKLEKEEAIENDKEKEILNRKIARYERAFKEIKRIIEALDVEEDIKVKETRVEIPVVERFVLKQNRQIFDSTPGIAEERKNDELFNDRRVISNIHRKHTLGVVEKPNLSTLEEHNVEKQEEKKEIKQEDVMGVNISLKMNDARYIFEINKAEEITIKCAIDDIVETKKLDDTEFNDLIKTLFIIKKKWENKYEEDIEDEEWSVELVTPFDVEVYEGNGVYPNNWGMFKEFINILLTKF